MEQQQQDTLEQQRWVEDGQPMVGGSARWTNLKETKMSSLVVKDNGGDFKMVPAGSFTARCFRIVDLGTQATSFNGQPKAQKKIMISWEVFGTDDNDQPLVDDAGKPLIVSKRYTNSLSSKAMLRKDLEGWRGKPFSKEELDGFDLANVLNQFCMVAIIHEPRNDQVYANVNSISKVPKEMRANLPKGVNDSLLFSIADPDMAAFEKFGEKLKNLIMQSVEWKEKGVKRTAGGPPAGHPANDIDEEDVPF